MVLVNKAAFGRMQQPRDLQQGKWQSCAAGGGLAGTAEETLPFFAAGNLYISLVADGTTFALRLWRAVNNHKGSHQQTHQVQAP